MTFVRVYGKSVLFLPVLMNYDLQYIPAFVGLVVSKLLKEEEFKTKELRVICLNVVCNRSCHYTSRSESFTGHRCHLLRPSPLVLCLGKIWIRFTRIPFSSCRLAHAILQKSR